MLLSSKTLHFYSKNVGTLRWHLFCKQIKTDTARQILDRQRSLEMKKFDAADKNKDGVLYVFYYIFPFVFWKCASGFFQVREFSKKSVHNENSGSKL